MRLAIRAARVVRAAPLALLLAVALPAGAGELKKAYFSATTPGAWSRHEMSAEGVGKSTYTMTRLPDRSDGRQQLEIRVEFTGGASAGAVSTSRYVLAKGFDLARDALGYNQAVDELSFVPEEGEPSALPRESLAGIREGASNFRSAFTFKAATEAEGRTCDLYVYRAPSGGPAPTIDDGEICLHPSVPFGMVRQVGKVKDRAGKVQSSYTLRLVASGRNEGSTPAVETDGKAPARHTGPLAFKEAYEGEQVKLEVEVVAGSKGKRLSVTLVNKTDQPLRVVIPKGKTTLRAGSMLETLTLVNAGERTVDVPGGGSAPPVELGQDGERGAVEGKFTLAVYEGDALFHGSITSDTLGK